MKSTIINCEIHGDIDSPEFGTLCSFIVSSPITFSRIDNLFPYEGIFHYRAKINGNDIGCNNLDYVWLDLNKNDEIQDILQNKQEIEIQALPLLLPCENLNSNNNYNEYFNEINQEVGIYSSIRPTRHSIVNKNKSKEFGASTKKAIMKIIPKSMQKTASSSISSVSESATSFWKATTSLFHNIGNQITNSILTDESEEKLANLSDDLSSKFDDNNGDHVCIIIDLWSSLFPELKDKYQRESDIWKEVGFQNKNPINDLKLSGILSLKSMSYLAHTYPSKTQDMIKKNKANIKVNYPFAIVGINICLLLAEHLNIRNGKYLSIQANYWEIFENPNAFYEMFCICFIHVDYLWNLRKADRSQFGVIINEIKAIVTKILNNAPKSVQEFKIYAKDEGVFLLNE